LTLIIHLANKFFAARGASERVFAGSRRRIAEALCAGASLCPSDDQKTRRLARQQVDLRGFRCVILFGTPGGGPCARL
jgi:hypothetical protein